MSSFPEWLTEGITLHSNIFLLLFTGSAASLGLTPLISIITTAAEPTVIGQIGPIGADQGEVLFPVFCFKNYIF